MVSTEALLTYVVFPVIGAAYALLGALWAYATKLNGAGERRMDRLQKDGYEFRLYCSQQYASVLYTKDVELRMTQSLARIEDKLDRLIDQMVDRARLGRD